MKKQTHLYVQQNLIELELFLEHLHHFVHHATHPLQLSTLTTRPPSVFVVTYHNRVESTHSRCPVGHYDPKETDLNLASVFVASELGAVDAELVP